jgi:hypothetical protein
MRNATRIGLLLLLAAVLAIPVAAETLRLKTGRILHGDILNADTEGFQFKRYDNGGSLFLPWGSLASTEVSRLRGALMPETAAARPMVKGLRVVTDQQSVYEGVVVEDTAEKLTLKLGAKKFPIPVKSIRQRVEVELDAEKVFTAEEQYDQKVAEIDATTADGNMVLAEFALAHGLSAKARTHYEKVKEVDPARKESIDKILADFDRRMKEAEAKKLRADILALSEAGKFDQVKDMLAKLKESFEGTEAAQDVDSLTQKIQAEQEKFVKNRDEQLKKKIAPDWYETMDRLIRRKVAERNVTLEVAKAYVEGQLEAAIKATLASKYEIKDADVDRYWAERPAGTNRSASYGSGSWVIAGGQSGPIQLKGAQQQPQQNPRGGNTGGLNRSNARSTLDRLLGGGGSRGNQRQQQPQAQAKPPEYKLDTAEEWWQSVTGLTRSEWLRAVFAEKALKVSSRKERACLQCGGQGTFTYSSPGGQEEVPCKRCHGTKNDVTVIFQ